MKKTSKFKEFQEWKDERRDDGLSVVLYWVGDGLEPSPSVRSTGAYSRGYGRSAERPTPRLEELQEDLRLNGYNTRIVTANSARSILSRYPVPKERKAPKFAKPDKKARKAPKAAEKFSKYRESGYVPVNF